MNIIVRTTGERTTDECIRRASKQGTVHVVNACPFGEAIRQTYTMAMDFNQKWTPVIDADVLLHDNVLSQAIKILDDKSNKFFCLDGKTNDKILMKNRRAGVHIYRTSMLQHAIKYIDNNHIKPESNVRLKMNAQGFPTYTCELIFGLHDYEQYYRDLWRKAVCQTRKLAGMTGKRPVKWKRLAKSDKDFLVIYHAHLYGKKLGGHIVIDARKMYGAKEGIEDLGLKEKGEYRP